MTNTRISYREYKLNYSNFKTVKGSYDAETKTIELAETPIKLRFENEELNILSKNGSNVLEWIIGRVDENNIFSLDVNDAFESETQKNVFVANNHIKTKYCNRIIDNIIDNVLVDEQGNRYTITQDAKYQRHLEKC